MAEEVDSSPGEVVGVAMGEPPKFMAEVPGVGGPKLDGAQQHGDGVGGSLQKRKRVTHAAAPAVPAAVVVDVETMFGMAHRSVVDISGRLVDLAELKEVGRSRGGGKRQVLAMCLADATGIACVSLWSPVAEAVNDEVQRVYDESPEAPRLVIKGAEVVTVSTTPLKLAKLQSRKGTFQASTSCYIFYAG